MKVFDIELESTIHVLKYDITDNFSYEEIARITRDSRDLIHFTLLIHVKQSKKTDKGRIKVFFAHIEDCHNGSQKLSRIPIGTIDLNDSSEQKTHTIGDGVRSDPWEIRQTIKWNVKNVPTQGPGSYAALLVADPVENSNRRLVLDCAYLDVL